MSEELFDQEQNVEATKPYSVIYTDGSYMVYDLTPEDYTKIKAVFMSIDCCDISTVTELSVGLVRLKDVRSVIVQRPPQENKATNPLLTDDELVWIEKVKRANILAEGVDDNEYDF